MPRCRSRAPCRCFSAGSVDDHHCIETRLFEPRCERAWQSTRRKRCCCIESARAAATAATLHEMQNAEGNRKVSSVTRHFTHNVR